MFSLVPSFWVCTIWPKLLELNGVKPLVPLPLIKFPPLKYTKVHPISFINCSIRPALISSAFDIILVYLGSGYFVCFRFPIRQNRPGAIAQVSNAGNHQTLSELIWCQVFVGGRVSGLVDLVALVQLDDVRLLRSRVGRIGGFVPFNN